MAKITIDDMRRAIAYGRDCNVYDLTDEEFLALDFLKDFHFGNIRVVNIAIELQRIHGIFIPVEFFKEREDDTVRAFMEAANKYLPD